MPLKKKPMSGMKDILPREMELREYITGMIRETYASFGFTSIDTPALEHIENLSGRKGGENEKLIFQILKRGEKLNLAQAKEAEDLVDAGLRYDLTVPLSRYYANHENELPSPFKALQMGYVWRAERPQKGRYRQFMQCDIDIVGEQSNLAEIELLLATSALLEKIGFLGFTIRINDRRILKAMADYSGFTKEEQDEVFILLDKMDKIGEAGVREALLEKGYQKEAVQRYLDLFLKLQETEDALSFLQEFLNIASVQEALDSLTTIRDTVTALRENRCSIVFDPTLVRGMSYYTGTIFEIAIEGFSGSVGGGGRYDEMIGDFTGRKTPACGCSIGFERIILLLAEQNYQIPKICEKKAYLVEKGISPKGVEKIFELAEKERHKGNQVLMVRMKKNKKFQKEQLLAEGFQNITEYFADSFQE